MRALTNRILEIVMANNAKQGLLISALFLVVLAGACKEKLTVYDVNDLEITQPGADKPNVKSDEEFISIAYSDLFGTTISRDQLDVLSLAYVSFGDKRLIIDMIIRNFLNEPTADIPTALEMNADPEKFVTDAFRKFLIREPNEFEKWYISNLIISDTAVSPEVVYYGFMTCNEYRFY